MQFGVRKAEAPEYDPESAGGGGSYIKYFKDNQTTLRFLQPINDWTEVWMHFSAAKSRDYPCTGDRSTCPGCTSDNEREAKASKRYIVNALSPATGYVDLWKIPFSIIDDLMRQEEKWGTIRDRDYTVIKSKNNAGQTGYSVDREDPDKMDLEPFASKMKDHQEALADAFREVWGALPGEEDYSGGELYSAPQKPRVSISTPEPQKSWSDGGFPKDPPSEPAAQSEPEQQELTEAQLRAMSIPELQEIYRIAAVEIPGDFNGKDDLVDNLIAQLS